MTDRLISTKDGFLEDAYLIEGLSHELLRAACMIKTVSGMRELSDEQREGLDDCLVEASKTLRRIDEAVESAYSRSKRVWGS